MSDKLSDQVTGEQEDLVWKARLLIQELGKIQDRYFHDLLIATGLNSTPIDEYLHDYIFNSNEDVDFADYLIKMNR